MVEDECRLQQFPNKFNRWGIRGRTPIVKIRREVNSVSFYAGLSLKNKGMIGHICKRQNSLETIKWLNLVKSRYESKGKVLIVWDNASWHKSKEIKQWLGNNPGVVELMNFPPYSPDLNPQEHVWKEMRKDLSITTHKYTFKESIARACRFLQTRKFDYKFV